MPTLTAEDEIEKIRIRAERPLIYPQEAQGLRKVMMWAHCRNSDEKLRMLIKLAAHGDSDAYAALCFAAGIVLFAKETLPEILRVYVAALLMRSFFAGPERGFGAVPGRGRGRRSERKNVPRDFLVYNAVCDLVTRGWLPTRNRETQSSECACSIVQQGLAKAGIHMSEARVEDIWRSEKEWWQSFSSDFLVPPK